MHCNNNVVLLFRLLEIGICVVVMYVPMCVCVVLWCMHCVVTYCECASSVLCRVWHSDKKGTGENKA